MIASLTNSEDLPLDLEGWKPKNFSKSGYHFIRGYSSAMQGKIDEAKQHLSILNNLKEAERKLNINIAKYTQSGNISKIIKK